MSLIYIYEIIQLSEKGNRYGILKGCLQDTLIFFSDLRKHILLTYLIIIFVVFERVLV